MRTGASYSITIVQETLKDQMCQRADDDVGDDFDNDGPFSVILDRDHEKQDTDDRRDHEA